MKNFLCLIFLITSVSESFAGDDNNWKKWLISYLSCNHCSFDMSSKVYEKKTPSENIVESVKFIRIDSTKEYMSAGEFEAVRNYPEYMEIDHETKTIIYQTKQKKSSSIQSLYAQFSDTLYQSVIVKEQKKLSDGDLYFLLHDEDSSFRSMELIFSKEHALKFIRFEMNPETDWALNEMQQPYFYEEFIVLELKYSNYQSNVQHDPNLFDMGNYVRKVGNLVKGVNKLSSYNVSSFE